MNLFIEPTPLLSVCYSFDEEWGICVSRERLLERIHELTYQEETPTLIYVTHHTEEILPVISHTATRRSYQVEKQT